MQYDNFSQSQKEYQTTRLIANPKRYKREALSILQKTEIAVEAISV